MGGGAGEVEEAFDETVPGIAEWKTLTCRKFMVY
jgi:hypothetical protein